jgi:trigger factor
MYSAAEDDKMVELLLQNQREALKSDIITGKAINFLLENNK